MRGRGGNKTHSAKERTVNTRSSTSTEVSEQQTNVVKDNIAPVSASSLVEEPGEVSDNRDSSIDDSESEPSLAAYVCPDCNSIVTDDHMATQCEVCDSWYHTVCQGISDLMYRLMEEDLGQISWYCRPCKRGAKSIIRRLMIINDKQVKMQTELRTLKDRVDIMEKKDNTPQNMEPGLGPMYSCTLYSCTRVHILEYSDVLCTHVLLA